MQAYIYMAFAFLAFGGAVFIIRRIRLDGKRDQKLTEMEQVVTDVKATKYIHDRLLSDRSYAEWVRKIYTRT